MLEFRDYLRYSNKYLALAEEAALRNEDTEWLLIPATILAWSAVELFVNNRFSELSSLPEGMFELHERAFLQERRLRFMDRGEDIGRFVLDGQDYQALENKMFFLLSKLGSRDTGGLRGGSLWDRFRRFKETRDSLVHPRKSTHLRLSCEDVNGHIETAKELIQELSQRIWRTRLDL